MVSDYEKTGANKQFLTHPNKDYATLATNMKAANITVANDLDCLVFTDKDINVYKALTDASGATAIPENSVIIANSSGHATSNANFKFNAAGAIMNLPIPFTLGFGDQSVDGSWRIRVTTGGIYFEKRVSGGWAEKGAVE